MTKQYEIPGRLQHIVNDIIREAEKELQEILRLPVKLDINVKDDELIINWVYIRWLVCLEFGIPEKLFTTGGRKLNIVTARQIYCHLCRHYLKMTFKSIADSLGKDHTTVIHSIRSIKDYTQSHDEYVLHYLTPLVQKLEAKINEKIQTTSEQDNAERA